MTIKRPPHKYSSPVVLWRIEKKDLDEEGEIEMFLVVWECFWKEPYKFRVKFIRFKIWKNTLKEWIQIWGVVLKLIKKNWIDRRLIEEFYEEKEWWWRGRTKKWFDMVMRQDCCLSANNCTYKPTYEYNGRPWLM